MDEPGAAPDAFFSSPMQPVAQTGGLVTIPDEDAGLVRGLFIGSLTAATNERSIIYENASVKISVAYEFRAYAVSDIHNPALMRSQAFIFIYIPSFSHHMFCHIIIGPPPFDCEQQVR